MISRTIHTAHSSNSLGVQGLPNVAVALQAAALAVAIDGEGELADDLVAAAMGRAEGRL